MKKKSILQIISIVVVIAIFSSFSFAAGPSFDDLLSSAGDYFSADFFSVSDGYKLDLGMKDQVLKTIISNIPQLYQVHAATGSRTHVYVNKLRLESISGLTLNLKADIRVKYYRIQKLPIVGTIQEKLADKNGTCSVNLTLKVSHNDLVIDKTRISNVNIDFTLSDYIIGGILPVIIADAIIKAAVKINDSGDKTLLPISKLVPEQYARLDSVTYSNQFMHFNFIINTPAELEPVKNLLEAYGLPAKHQYTMFKGSLMDRSGSTTTNNEYFNSTELYNLCSKYQMPTSLVTINRGSYYRVQLGFASGASYEYDLQKSALYNVNYIPYPNNPDHQFNLVFGNNQTFTAYEGSGGPGWAHEHRVEYK